LVDTTFVRIQTPTLNPWEYFNQNKNDFGLLYQVVCSLGKPFRFLSFNGPYKGSAADVSIVRETIIPKLKKNEKVMCDKGYWQENRCWCPPTGNMKHLSVHEKIERRKVTRIRHLIERLICRLKSWGIFKKIWRSGYSFHKLCATVAARLTQLELYMFPLT
jgi:hypothetical protein